MLVGGLGLGAGLLAGCQREMSPGGQADNIIQSKSPTSATEPVTTGRNLSSGRYREVDIVIMRPAGITDPLPVCVAMHASSLGGAKSFLELGVPDMLTKVVAGGSAPFAVAAVDGGDWVGYKDDDPQRMLFEDLPGWLDYHDLASTPFSVLGISEGGAGALNMARTPGLSAVAVISPKLYDNWGDAQSSGMFDDGQKQWEQREPLRHMAEFATQKLGVWCGTEDRAFIGPARRLAENTKAVEAAFTPGGHDEDYWKSVLPEALKFVGSVL
ncbi:Enterochelin esterase [Actinokineospora alba]|uniref:Enterochelin esterase n=1 Tax=Actinokineospora alba TaxID=504798 RepID=A0A1H0IC50_9PSEU|nr:alpha/beta hydrolase-fold protein [Actinokineospora alba]TDP71012.1 enterochelin esterase-like enzyme [Actinokineospora alba]SDI88003.1 Enterochelin esterase [Actinokineospora alba]SDO28661.1 Enterochelin esterase [Actinokineospora alba]